MLVFTNRSITRKTDSTAFARSFIPGGTRLAVASVQRPSATADWKLSGHNPDIADGEALNLLLPLFSGKRPVCVYVHGNSTPPSSCFDACAALESLYGVEVVGFSWASEGCLADGSPLPGVPANAKAGEETDLDGVTSSNRASSGSQQKIRRYHQSKTNAQDSVDALARFLRLVGTARLHANGQPFTLVAHSLGSHMLQYALDIDGAGESVATAYNVALVAPCVRAAGHADWVADLRPKGQVVITYNKADNVLFGARIADGRQEKLGAEPGSGLVRAPRVRYVSFTNAANGFGGHNYFIQGRMPKKAKALFKRIFSSRPDLATDESPSDVYPLGCDPDGVVCYMAVPERDVG